ncbi:MAG: methionyl-tRNA formyltransferase [Oscillospiraceae bacterium]
MFMGTPDIAAKSLAALLQQGHKVKAVFTREDKPVGRKQLLTAPPVKVLAAENRIPVYQPQNLRSPETWAQIEALAPELVVVVAYGRILPPQVLSIPRYGCINLHVSLLPKYRGAAPIQWAVINGEAATGVSIMQMDEGLDTGPVLKSQAIGIGPSQTAGEVFEMVTSIGARLLCETVEQIEKGGLAAAPQQGEASFAPPLTKEMAFVDFTRPAGQLHNLVRGCNPWPLAWFWHGGLRVKLLRTRLEHNLAGKPGEILLLNPLTIACGTGALVLENLVPQGSRPMLGQEWAAGRRFTPGGFIV